MIFKFINDDINMPGAMAIVWEIARKDTHSKKYAEVLEKFDEVLGLDIVNAKTHLEEYKSLKSTSEDDLPEEVKSIIEERKLARENKDYQKSDELRDKLKELGFIIKDTKEGYEITKI